MNPYYSNLILNGLFICLYAQIILVGVINLFQRSKRSKILGAICCIFSASFLYTLFWNSLKDDVLMNILLGGTKSIFIPALLYLYILFLGKTVRHKLDFLIHIIPPLIVHVSYLLLKFGFTGFYQEHIVIILCFLNAFHLVSYILYFILGVKAIKQLEPLVVPDVLRRNSVFYYIMFWYGLFLAIESLVPFLFSSEDFQRSFNDLTKDFNGALAIIMNSIILIFAILETPIVRNIVRERKIYTGFDSISDEDQLRAFIHQVFVSEERFISDQFNLKQVMQEFGVKEEEFKIFLRKHYDQSVIEFVNTHRVNKFKRLVLEEENKKYSLMGIANMAGFKSKATFYRNFNAYEGMTPRAYVDSIQGRQEMARS